MLAVLFTPLHKSAVAVGFVIYFATDVLFHLAGGALVWGQKSIHPQRSLLLALMNYGELTVSFAVMYLYFHGLEKGVDALPTSPAQALYFSLMTATSLGYGNMDPSTTSGQLIVAIQITVFVVFLLLFISIFASRATDGESTGNGRSKT